jgi:hypothetical protein
LNQIVSKSNQMTSTIFDTIQFGSILTKIWTRKIVNCDRKNWKIHKTEFWRALLDIYAFMVDNSLEYWPFSWWPIFFHDCWCSFILNWMILWIKSISDWKWIERFLQLLDRKSNEMETDSIWQPWFSACQRAYINCISLYINGM